MRISNANKGVTLLELLLTVGLLAIILGAIYGVFIIGLRSWKTEDPQFLLQQEVTTAVNRMERELKKASGVTRALDKTIEFNVFPGNVPLIDDNTVSLWHFNEGAGTIVGDATGNNNGSLKGVEEPAWTTEGEDDKALKFDGIDDYVNCGNGSTLNITDKLTIEVWIQPAGSADEAIVYKDGAYRLYINSSHKLVGSIYYSGVWHDVISSSSIVRNESTWTNVSLTYNKDEGTGEELKLYINGAIDVTGNHTTSINTSPHNLYIGKDHNNEQYPFEGVIDEVCISNDVRRTRISCCSATGSYFSVSGNLDDKLTLTIKGTSWQLIDGYTKNFTINYYDEDYNELIPPAGTATQAERNNIKIVKVSLELEKDEAKSGLENSTTLRGELPGEAEEEGGLVGYWKMNEHFWNGTAGEVIDSSGNNNHGTAKNGANTSVGGKIGRCGYFDGNNDYIDVGSDSSLDVNKVTVMAWVNVNLYHNGKILCKSPQNSTNIDFLFSIGTDAKAYFRHYDGSSWHGVGSNDRMYSDRWYHIAGTFDGASWKIYIDGEVNGVTNDEVALSTGGALEIGRYYHSTPRQYFNRLIDEVKIYNRALSGEEIKEEAFGFTDSKKDDFTGTYDNTIWESDYVGLAHP